MYACPCVPSREEHGQEDSPMPPRSSQATRDHAPSVEGHSAFACEGFVVAPRSAAVRIAASPFSKSPPTILSMFMNMQKPFSMNEWWPYMLHVTSVWVPPLPIGLNV